MSWLDVIIGRSLFLIDDRNFIFLSSKNKQSKLLLALLYLSAKCLQI